MGPPAPPKDVSPSNTPNNEENLPENLRGIPNILERSPGNPEPPESNPEENSEEESESSDGPSFRFTPGDDSPAAAKGSPPPAASASSSRKAAKSRGANASGSADRMAKSLKSMMPGTESMLGASGAAGALKGGPGILGDGRPGSGAARTGVPAPAAPAATGALPQPAARPGEDAAWLGPYRSLVESRGLSTYRGPDGRLSFRRRDGSPATQSEIAELRTASEREPAALGKYPDFFKAISRENYDQLRSDVTSHSGRPEYKHIGLTEDPRRDMVWTKSCDRVSGDCNPRAEESNYKKNDFVKPKTASNLWDDLFGIVDDAAAKNEQDRLGAMTGMSGRPRVRVPDFLTQELAAPVSEVAANTSGAPAGAPGAGPAARRASAPTTDANTLLARADKTLPSVLWKPSEPGRPGRPRGLALGLLGAGVLALAWKLKG